MVFNFNKNNNTMIIMIIIMIIIILIIIMIIIEGILIGAQEQAIRTRSIQHRIDKVDISTLCRICSEREKSVAHIVSECGKLAQKQYKHWRHDKVAQAIHWQICKEKDLEHDEK